MFFLLEVLFHRIDGEFPQYIGNKSLMQNNSIKFQLKFIINTADINGIWYIWKT